MRGLSMISAIYILTALRLARRYEGPDSGLPQATLTQLTDITMPFVFLDAAGAVMTVDSARCVIKGPPSGPVLLLDSALPAEGEGNDLRHVASWPAAQADGQALRDYLLANLGANNQAAACCEVEWILDGVTDRVSFPITLQAAFLLPPDTVPDPIADETWAWIKATLQEGENVTLTADDGTKTITVSSEGGPDEIAISDVTGLQGELDAKAAATHSHAIGDVTGLQGALDAKAAASHSHAISDVTGLQGALDAKAAASHSHAIGDVTGLQGALDAKAAASHSHAIGDVTGLQGALDAKAAASHSHAISDVTGLQSALNAKAAASHSHAISDVTGLQGALDAKAAAARTITGAGLATGGGNLTSDRIITVTAASQGQAEDGSSNSVVMTPLSAAQALTKRTPLCSIRAFGALDGYASPSIPPSGATFQLNTESWIPGTEGLLVIALDSFTPLIIDITLVNPMTGSVWVDASVSDLAGAVAAEVLAMHGPSGAGWLSSVEAIGTSVLFTTASTGTSAWGYFELIAVDGLTGDTSQVFGSDGSPASGETDNVVLATPGIGRKLRLKSLWLRSAAATPIKFGWWAGGVFTEILQRTPSVSAPTRLEPTTEEELTAWMTDGDTNASLMMRFDTVPEGGTYPVIADLEDILA